MNATQQLDLIDRTLAGPYGALPLTGYLRRNGSRWVGSALPPGIRKGPGAKCDPVLARLEPLPNIRTCHRRDVGYRQPRDLSWHQTIAEAANEDY